MKNQSKLIDGFWQWILANQSKFELLVDSEAPFWDVALGQLQRVDKRLRFEVSEPDDNAREFVITAEGDADAFPLVDNMVESAPVIAGWQFIALVQPKGFDFEMNYEGIAFDPGLMWFTPLESQAHPTDLGISVGVPNFTSAIKRQAENAVLVILDAGLGERSAASDIQHVEVSKLPKSPETSGYIPLPELANFIEFRKEKLKTP